MYYVCCPVAFSRYPRVCIYTLARWFSLMCMHCKYYRFMCVLDLYANMYSGRVYILSERFYFSSFSFFLTTCIYARVLQPPLVPHCFYFFFFDHALIARRRYRVENFTGKRPSWIVAVLLATAKHQPK